MERTKTFLVIFHFVDDFSKQNIRFRKKKFVGYGLPDYLYIPQDYPTPQECPYILECPVSCGTMEPLPVQSYEVMTWASSHPELGLLSELLSYANIINGLKESEKRKLRGKLEVMYELDEEGRKIKQYMAEGNREQALKVYKDIISNLSNYNRDFEDITSKLNKIMLHGIEFGRRRKEEYVFCVELCPEYIDYLKTVLKPYLRD